MPQNSVTMYVSYHHGSSSLVKTDKATTGMHCEHLQPRRHRHHLYLQIRCSCGFLICFELKEECSFSFCLCWHCAHLHLRSRYQHALMDLYYPLYCVMLPGRDQQFLVRQSSSYEYSPETWHRNGCLICWVAKPN